MINLQKPTTMSTEISIELMKSMALMQHNGEDFFLLDEKVYEGTIEDAKEQYKEDNPEDAFSFPKWCFDNLTEVEPIDGDEERNGYIVLTDEEADEKAEDYIKDSLWAFNASFIIEHSKLPYEAKEMVESFQSDKCEGANDTIEALIEDMDSFIEDAIAADGRGHFINSYDGEENEETIEGSVFYIYRIN